jgi:hypothetical protein
MTAVGFGVRSPMLYSNAAGLVLPRFELTV